jgi:hypothetical protein
MEPQNTNPKTETEKATEQLFDMISNSWKPREQRELAEWIAGQLPPETVKSLAADYDETENRFDA